MGEGMEHRPYRPVLSTGQAGMPTLPECLSLPVSELSGRSGRRMFMKLRGEVSGGENRYILRNKANKSFRINKNSSKEVQKGTRKRTETPKRNP